MLFNSTLLYGTVDRVALSLRRHPICRDGCLRKQGFADCFKGVKEDEDAKALALMPSILR